MTSPSAFTALCPGCFAERGNASTCPHCGYDESLKRGPLVLAHRTLLHNGQYLIGKVLGKPGGFGITYLALDTRLETRVAIKEYLPRDLAGRDAGHATVSAHSAQDDEFFRYGLTQFLQEARTLARFDHANIVRVRNFFEENGTGYLVMDYYDGVTLADHLAQQPQGRLTEETAVGILMPILDGLREVHAKNILHRDIKPQNIYLTTGNRPILLDFGAARQAMSERSRSLSVVLSEGYAPYEQYHRRGEQGPWTDIYASAAVLYHAVAGEPPPPATERVAEDELDIDALGVSAALTSALRAGLAVDPRNRPQTVAEFQGLLLGDGKPPVLTKVVGLQPEKAEPTSLAKRVISPPSKPPDVDYTWASIVIILGTLFIWLYSENHFTGLFAGSGDRVETAVPTPAIKTKPDMKSVPASGSENSRAESVAYKEEEKDFALVGGPRTETVVVALVKGKRLEPPRAETSPMRLIAQKDFNGDGVMDALIEIVEAFGGSSEHTSASFITVADGKILMAPVPEGKIVEEGGRFLIKAESDDATEYWGFNGQKAIKVRSLPHRKLETIAEVEGDPGYLEFDLDMDGKPEKILCDFWGKYNIYTACSLPLPGGMTQDIKFNNKNAFYCVRVGVLKTQSNGYRELVCNNNSVIRFDGKAWMQLKPAP